jgi:hypothetical protein
MITALKRSIQSGLLIAVESCAGAPMALAIEPRCPPRRRCGTSSFRLWLVAMTGMAAMASSHAARPDVMTEAMCREAMPQVAKAFGGVLEPIRQGGYCVAGDFSGDGRPDVFMVVRVLVKKVAASTGIKSIYPFFNKEGEKDRLQFLVLHAATNGDKSTEWTQGDKFLLDGGSPILILEEQRMGEPDMKRIPQRSKAARELQVPQKNIKGEAVLLGTEAVQAIIYWNGKTYIFHEDPSGS